MPKLQDSKSLREESAATLLPITVIVAARNEARNLPRCLESLRDVGEVYVIDSQSTDGTVEIAQSYGAHVVQFHYQGGWPKKRQWAMESLPLAYDWIFLVDADEALTPELADEVRLATRNPDRRRLLHRVAYVFSRAGVAPQRCEFLQAFVVPAEGRGDSSAASRIRTSQWRTWKFTSISCWKKTQ